METVLSPLDLVKLINTKLPQKMWIKIIIWIFLIGIIFWTLPFVIGGYLIYYFYKKLKGTSKFIPTIGITGLLTLVIGIGWIVIFASASQSANTSDTTTKNNGVQAAKVSITSSIQPTPTQAIDLFPHTKNYLTSNQNSDGKEFLKQFQYFPTDSTVGNSSRINVDMNFGTYDEGNPIQIKQEMATVIEDLHQDHASVDQIWITAYGPFVDKYGNQSTNILYQVYVNNSDMNQINWNTDDNTLQYTIIPGVWHVNANNLNN